MARLFRPLGDLGRRLIVLAHDKRADLLQCKLQRHVHLCGTRTKQDLSLVTYILFWEVQLSVALAAVLVQLMIPWTRRDRPLLDRVGLGRCDGEREIAGYRRK